MLSQLHRPRSLALAVLVLVLVGWFVAGSVQVWLAYREGRTAQTELSTARADLSGGGLTAGAPVHSLRVASGTLIRVRSRVDGPLVLPLRVLPVLGRQVRAVGSLADAGARIAGVTASSVSQAQALLGGHPVGEGRVIELRRLSSVAGNAEQTLAEVAVTDRTGLIGPVRRRRDQLATELAKGIESLRDARNAAGLAARLLQGPTNYLLLIANNGEMRAGSGTFLTAGILNGAGGKISVTSLASTADLALPAGRVPVTGDLAARWGWLGPSEEWRNLATTPRFPATAALAAQMWRARSGQAVQGVMAVDIETFREVMEVTGPLQVDGRSFDAGNVEKYLLHDQYENASFDPRADAGRTSFLHQLATAALRSLQSGKVSLSHLTRLGPVVSGRHLMAWSANAIDQAAWRSTGVSGDIGGADLSLAVINLGGNKLDQFLGVTSTVAVTRHRLGTEVTIRVMLQNRTPPGEPAYIAGPNPGVAGSAYGVYTGLVSLDVPGRASEIRVSGTPGLAAAGADGSASVYAGAVSVPAQKSVNLTYELRLPRETRGVRVDPSARLPATVWTYAGDRFDDASVHFLSW